MKIPWQRLLRGTAFTAAIGGFIFAWVMYKDIVIYYEIDNLATTNDATKARLFDHEYPTAEQISGYLSDATIVTSSRISKLGAPVNLYENVVIYLDADSHNYLRLTSGFDKADVGSWSTHNRLLISTFRGQWKYRWVQLFCRGSRSVPTQYQVDGCKVADELVRLFSRGNEQIYEYKKGNTFNIADGVDLSFKVPRDSSVSFDSLSVLYSSSNNKKELQ